MRAFVEMADAIGATTRKLEKLRLDTSCELICNQTCSVMETH